MADKYIDGELATGTQSGDDWTNAYYTEANIQGAYDQLTAGDTLHATRTQTLTQKIDIDQASGSLGSPITVLGYNYNSGTPVVDGTPYVIDANSAAANCILVDDKDHWRFENVEFKNATGDNAACTTDYADYWVFKNCDSHSAGADGWGNATRRFRYSHFVLCTAYSNGANGIRAYGSTYTLCTARDNTSDGFKPDNCGVMFGCVAYGNGGYDCNYGGGSFPLYIANCVSDEAAAAGIASLWASSPIVVVASRITGSPTGILGNGSDAVIDLWNFNNCTAKTSLITVDQQIRGADTRTESGTEGYIDAAGGNYGLTNSASARRQEVAL